MADGILGGMYAGKISAWHHLGTWGDHIRSATQGIEIGGMGFNIHKTPLMAIAPDGTQIATTLYGLLREPVAADPEWVTLGTCGADYDFWQNADVAQRVDLLSESTGWEFATCGVLSRGKTFFVCLNMGGTDIAGESYDKFFTYIEERDGKTRSWGIVSNVRVVCRNTCNLALKNATGKIGIRHGVEYKSTADWAMDMMAEAQKHGNDVASALNTLAEIAMDDERMTDVLNAVAPMPTMPRILTMPNLTGRMAEKRDAAEYAYERAIVGANRIRDRVILNYNSLNDTMPANLQHTGMAAFQAVTQFSTHERGTLGVRGRKMDAQSRAMADLFDEGQVMRDAAYTAIVGDF